MNVRNCVHKRGVSNAELIYAAVLPRLKRADPKARPINPTFNPRLLWIGCVRLGQPFALRPRQPCPPAIKHRVFIVPWPAFARVFGDRAYPSFY